MSYRRASACSSTARVGGHGRGRWTRTPGVVVRNILIPTLAWADLGQSFIGLGLEVKVKDLSLGLGLRSMLG